MLFSKTEVYQFYKMKSRVGRGLDRALRNVCEKKLNHAAWAVGVERDVHIEKANAAIGKRTQSLVDHKMHGNLSDKDTSAELNPDTECNSLRKSVR